MNIDESVSNISGREVNNRFIIGVIMVVIAVVVSVLLFFSGWSPLWGILAFFPFLGAIIGFLQAKKKVCIALAAQGTCNLNGQVEKISDEKLVSRLKELGNQIVYRAVMIAAVLTALVVIGLEISQG